MSKHNASILLLALCALLQDVSAQSSKVFRVKAGQYPDKIIPYPDRYQFDQFRKGTAEFINGRSSQARFNYAYIGGHVLFVDGRPDTLEIIDKALLKRVTIGDKEYRFNRQYGYCEVVKAFNRGLLAKRTVLARIGTDKGGPYGISYTASSVTSYKSFTGDRTTGKLNADAEGVFSYHTALFLIDNNNRFYVPKPASVRKLFPSHKKQIGQYLDENPVNFASEQDLLRLMTFCSGLDN
nr:hypothetical protein [uncultured Dyadobacter sp.]